MTLAKYKILQKLISRTLTFLCGHRKIVDIFIKYIFYCYGHKSKWFCYHHDIVDHKKNL